MKSYICTSLSSYSLRIKFLKWSDGHDSGVDTDNVLDLEILWDKNKIKPF